MSKEEKEAIEQEFQFALGNIVSKIKGETATAIIVCEQSMILLFKKLMLKIERQQKEIEDLKLITNQYNCFLKYNDKNDIIIFANSRYFENGAFIEKFISKDKIKELLEEVKENGKA